MFFGGEGILELGREFLELGAFCEVVPPKKLHKTHTALELRSHSPGSQRARP